MKKKLLLTIITILMSITLFPNKVEAIVMWMQCTDSPTDEISDEDDFKYYSSFAVINDKYNAGIRNLVYDSTGFYNNKKPTYIMNLEGDGNVSKNMCWYEKEFDKIKNCDKEEDFVEISKLLAGVCPQKVYSSNVSGLIRKDMLVLSGTKNASNKAELNESQLVIYGITTSPESDTAVHGVVVEAYEASTGKYGFAIEYSYLNKRDLGINGIFDAGTGVFGEGDALYDLINIGNYDESYMSWEAMTQARRIEKYGKDYFQILDDSIRPWVVNISDKSRTIVDENLIYYSNDSNGKLSEWVSDWYNQYEEELSKQFEAFKNLESTKYEKLYIASKEIDEAISKNKKYTFNSDYSASQMVLDLNDAYTEIKIILNDDDEAFSYDSYNSNCELDKKTYDVKKTVFTKFMCDVFKTTSVNKFDSNRYYVQTANGTMIDELIVTMLDSAIAKQSGSDVSFSNIQNTAEEYAILFTTAIKYIEQNESLTGEAARIILDLEDKYTEMTKKLGANVIISCEDLIGDELREKIKSYLNIVKIVVPILLIMFGIIDFTKAIFSSDEEQMKKAQKNFIKRLGIAILFFLTPTIVDLLLGLANKVWTFIEPNSCGIFE